MDGFILTRLEHLETLGLVRKADLHKSVKRTREALDAKDPEYDSPDHPIRLKAAEQFFKLADLYPKPNTLDSDPGRPVQVNIILTGSNGHAGPALQTHGVRLHLSDGDGDGT